MSPDHDGSCDIVMVTQPSSRDFQPEIPRPIFDIHRRVLILLSVLVVVLPEIAHAGDALARISDLRSMSHEMINRTPPVRIRGVVTWANGRLNMTVQDDSAGIWIDFVEARKRKVWR